MKANSKLSRLLALTLAIIMTFSLMAFPVSADSEVKELGLCKGDNVNAKLNALMETDEDTQWEYLAKTYTYKDGTYTDDKGEEPADQYAEAWVSVDGGTYSGIVGHTHDKEKISGNLWWTKYKHTYTPEYGTKDFGGITYKNEGKTYSVRVADTTDVYSVKVVDGRIQSVIALNEGDVTITYNMDDAVMTQEILAKAINVEESVLPESFTADDFTIKGVDDLKASEEVQTVTLQFNKNDYYFKSEKVTVNVIVNKANVTVTVKGNVNDTSSLAVITAGGELPEGFVTTNPADKEIDIWTIFAGQTNENETIVYVKLPAKFDSITNDPAFNTAFKLMFGMSFSEYLNQGMTVGEFKVFLTKLLELNEYVPIMTDTVETMVAQITKLPEVVDDVRVAFGTPSHAGVYAVLVVTDSKNYNAAYGFGGVVVVPNMRGNELVWNFELPESLTADALAKADLTATLYNNGVVVKDAKISYKYTGSYKVFFGLIKVKYNSSDVPTRVGSYTQVATCYSGDNISILPATRSFNIVEATDSKAVVSEPVEDAAAPAEVEDVIENVVDSAVAEVEDAVNVPENEEAAAPAEQPAEDVVAPAEPAVEEETPAAPAEDEAPAGEEAEADKGFSVIGSITEPVFGILNKGLSGLGKLF